MEKLIAEQLRASYEHLPVTLAVTIVNGLLLAYVIQDTTTPSQTIIIWLGLVFAQAIGRLLLWYSYPGATARPIWANLHVCGTLMSGILWGSLPFIVTLDETHMLFVALIIAGMCAGAATVHSTYFPASVAFIVPALVPLSIHLLIMHKRPHVVAGVMTCIFAVALCIISWNFRDLFNANVLAHLKLKEANIKLRAEMNSHRTTEAKLRQAQKLEAVGRLTAGIAHDFNNLLMAISGSAGLIAMRLPQDNPHTRQIENIMDAVGRGNTLTRQLLAFGRKQSLQPVWVNVNDVVADMERLLTSTLGRSCCARFELYPLPLHVFIDVAQLECAILNLVINARDAMPDGGSVTIKTALVTRSGDKSVLLSISDTGTGMSEQVSQQAFDPFFTTKEVGEGSGLGLSQVYGLMQQSGGATEIDSHLGLGTTINMYLPGNGQRP